MYVIGVEVPSISSFPSHNSFPVFDSNAWNRRSLVAPTNTTPPAVTIDPPSPNAPVLCTPFDSISSLVPSGTLQAMSPVLALTAVRCDHGGIWQGWRVSGSQNRAKNDDRPSG